MVARGPGGQEDESRREIRKEEHLDVFFWQQRVSILARMALSIKISWLVPTVACFLVSEHKNLRSLSGEIKSKLQTIHPNPGPGGRDKSEAGKKARKERRYTKREEKRRVRPRKKGEKYISIITWNVQRMSLGTFNKRKLKTVAKYAVKNGWEVVLLSEVRADRKGVQWLGEGENRVAVIHSEKAGIMLRGELLRKWLSGGQKTKQQERSVAIRIEDMVLISTYQPVWNGRNEDQLEREKAVVKELTEWAKKEDLLIIGGDFNAHVGGGEERPGVCGKFGLRESNRIGVELLEWCQENNLVHVGSFYNHKQRGTWFNNSNRRWYEIDGFIMRKDQRHKYVNKVSTVGEISISDHKPKLMKIKIDKKKWRRGEIKKKGPRIKWEALRNEETASRYREKVEEILRDKDMTAEDNTTNWNKITEVVLEAATETCGVQDKVIENPWMRDRDEEVRGLRARIIGAITRRNTALEDNNEEEIEASRTELKEARKDLKRKTRQWENEWWDNILEECNAAGERGDSGLMYKTLKKLGSRNIKQETNTTNIKTEEFREHFKKVSEERFENSPEEIEEVAKRIKDISDTEKAKEWKDILEAVPGREEIAEQIKKMRDSAPGDDGVRLSYLMKGGQEIFDYIIEMVQFMFLNGAETWEESLKVGMVIPLFKKGDRNDPNKYRGVCLLAMGSRILARVLANRLRIWAEKLALLDDSQSGFRSGRSTADATQVMVRIQEDSTDLRRRIEASGEVVESEEETVARLLDLRKAYPRVNKPLLWLMLERYGMGETCLRALKDLHESTVYRIRGKDGDSEPWTPERGLREGCPSSPPLFNIYHQGSMRVAKEDREAAAALVNQTVGVVYSWVPGNSFPSDSRWEKKNSEAVEIKVDNALFADDTTLAGKRKEMENGVRIVKEAMLRFEERNNEDKEEEVIFGTEDSGKTRMLGTWLGPKEDINQRLKRAGNSWRRVKSQLKKSKMSKRKQALVTQACVESTILFDCQARTWQISEIKRLQQFMDKTFRYIWSRKNQPPLMEMQQKGTNMQDVRSELGVKSIRSKIEKRVLSRVGHVIRMDDSRMTKQVTLGWMKELENWPKLPGKKRKTVLYWRKLIKEAGLDWTRIGMLTEDRKVWKGLVNERIKHIEEWEKGGGNKSEQERGERNKSLEVEIVFVCEICGQRCKSKAGLTNHRRKKHEVSKEKKKFNCDICTKDFSYMGALTNHQLSCEGVPSSQNMKMCGNCNREVTSSNFSRHRKDCRGENTNRRFKGPRTSCPNCNLEVSTANLSRNQKTCTIDGEAVH